MREADGAIVVGLGLDHAGFGFFEVGVGGHQVGFGVFQVGGGLQQRALEQGRIDERDDVAFVDAGVEVGVELGDRAGDLRADLDGDDRVDGAGGFDDIVDVATFDFGGEVLGLTCG